MLCPDDPNLAACYSFDGDTLDQTSNANHATAVGGSFDTGMDGQALRADSATEVTVVRSEARDPFKLVRVEGSPVEFVAEWTQQMPTPGWTFEIDSDFILYRMAGTGGRIRLVIDHEDPCTHCYTSPCNFSSAVTRGILTVKAVNSPGSLVTDIAPPCCLTTIS